MSGPAPDLHIVKSVSKEGETTYHLVFNTEKDAKRWVDASVHSYASLAKDPPDYTIVPVWLKPQPDYAVERYLAGLSEMLFARSEGNEEHEQRITDALDFIDLNEDQHARIDDLCDSFRNPGVKDR